MIMIKWIKGATLKQLCGENLRQRKKLGNFNNPEVKSSEDKQIKDLC